MFGPNGEDWVFVSRSNADDSLAAFSEHGFDLDGAHWPSVEHYYQATKFEDEARREEIRLAPHPRECAALAKRHRKRMRKDWKRLKRTVMTRGVYLKVRTHPDAARALLATGERRIVETSQYDYFWGCGRDGRGDNVYGEVLMEVRAKLREQGASEDGRR